MSNIKFAIRISSMKRYLKIKNSLQLTLWGLLGAIFTTFTIFAPGMEFLFYSFGLNIILSSLAASYIYYSINHSKYLISYKHILLIGIITGICGALLTNFIFYSMRGISIYDNVLYRMTDYFYFLQDGMVKSYMISLVAFILCGIIGSSTSFWIIKKKF